VLCVGVAVCGSCGSASETITSPSQTRCAIQTESGTMSFSADGGAGQIRVSTSRECSWSARSEAGWVVLTPPASGQGDGSIQFTVGRYGDPSTRSASITIEDRRLVVSQEGRRCEFRVSTTLISVDPSGGERTVQVEASSPECRWSAVAQEPWIVIASGAEGSGNGAVTIRVGAAAGPPRAGSVTIAGQVVRVDQGTGCTYSLGATSLEFGPPGGRGEIPVSTAPGCTWTAQASAPWITILGNPTSSGPGVLGFRVDATLGPPRNGTITIANLNVSITQGSGCAYTVTPSSVNAGSAATTGSIQVSAPPGCGWSATSSTSWVTISGASGGNGDGQVQFSVAANTGPARSGTLTIANQNVTVSQASGCTFTFNPPSVNAGAASTTGSIQVGAAAACTWSATSGSTWVTITGGSSGSGDGQVQFAIAANSGPARTTSISIGGQSVSVAQASGCTYSVSPGSQDIGPAGGSASASIATGVGCPWTASSNADWLSITTTSGTGPAQVPFSASANPGPPRSGTILVAGQLLTVNQASACTWTFVPPTHVFGAEGGNGNILVIVSGACTWNTVSNAGWITVTSGASGAGGGLVQFVVAANAGAARSGTLTIAGQRYDVTQAGR